MASFKNSVGLWVVAGDHVFLDSLLITDNVHFAYVFGASINYDRCEATMSSEDIFF